MSLIHDLQKAADQTGGSATRSARRTTARQLANFSDKFGIKDVRQIKPKTIVRFIDSLKASNSTRSLQNKMSHVREILRASKRDHLADENLISNSRLGISGASRIGTHEPVSDAQFTEMIKELPDDLRIATELQRALGLRIAEVVGAGRKDILMQLQRDIRREYRKEVFICEQTKGGKARNTSLSKEQYEKAQEVIGKAVEYLQSNNRKYLINGKSDHFKSAYDRMSNTMRRAGFTGKTSSHASRYSWSRERIKAYQTEGLSLREARLRTAQDLGHGPGRGRWVASIYAREG